MTAAPPWRRAAVTGAGVAVVWAAGRVPGPGVDVPGQPVSAFLGLAPLISAALVVELGALVWSWRRPRPDQVRLQSLAEGLSVGFALLQGGTLAIALEALQGPGITVGHGAAFRLAWACSGGAGAALVVLLARALDRHGMGGGVGALVLGDAAIRTAAAAADPAVREAPWVLAAALVLGVAGVRLLEARAPGTQVRVAPVGLAPLVPAALLLSLASIAAPDAVPPPGSPSYAAVDAILAVAFVRALQPLADPSGPPRALGWNAAGVVGLVALGWVSTALLRSPWVPSGAWFAACGLAADAAREWRAWQVHGPLVSLGPIGGVRAADEAVARVRAAGIPAHLRGSGWRGALHFFAPHVALELLVPADRAEEARRVAATG